MMSACASLFVAAAPARAQFAVIDIAAIVQMVEQLITMENQLVTLKDQLQNARDTFDSITGDRGMQDLLGDVARNYLPADINELLDVVNNASGMYGELAADYQRIIGDNTVLGEEVVGGFTDAQRRLIVDQRTSAASLQAMTQSALATTSARFESIESLIRAIGTAHDQKAILDLQARIQAETGMMQNEATKLNVLYQTSAARAQLREQRLHELGVADVGNLRDLPDLGL